MSEFSPASIPVIGLNSQPAVDAAPTTSVPILVLGGDHPYLQWWGTNGYDGMAQMYLDQGITPYIAINTDSVDGPGASDRMTWQQCKDLQDRGVEFVSHGYWHLDKWNRANTGIRIEYLGANGTATVQVQTAVPSTALVCTAGADSVTSTFSTDTTLSAVKATLEAANGGGKWRVTLDSILTGNESSTNLLGMNAARNILASTNNQYFCAGGGIELTYGTTPPGALKHVWVRRTSGGTFTVFGDGPQQYALSLGTNSLSTLVAGVNAAGVTGLTALLCDNGRTETATKPSYLIGDELATNLKTITYLEFTSRPQVMDAGLPNWYIIERQFQTSQALAATYGITLKHFAQSGGNFYPWHTNHSQYGLHRGNTLYQTTAPPVMQRQNIKNFVTHRTLTNTGVAPTYQGANILALADAMVGYSTTQKLEPWVFVANMHKLLADGTTPYKLPTNDPTYYDQTEADWYAFLKRVATYVAAGKLRTLTFSELAAIPTARPPNNLFFNPAFANAGASFAPATSAQDGGFYCPGWLVIRASTMSTMTISNGVLSCVNSSSTATELISQEISLVPGKSYEFNAYVDVTAYTTGAGIQWSFQSMHGQVKNLLAPATNYKVTGPQIFQTGECVMRVTIPKFENFTPAQAISAAETWDLSVNKNIKLNIQSVLSIDNLDCSVTAAAAGRAAAARAIDVATDINNAIKAAGTYTADYFNVATAVAGKVVITAPNLGTDQATSLSVLAATANSATAVIFGNATVEGRQQFLNPATSENFIFRVALRSSMQASFTISNPTCREVEYN